VLLALGLLVAIGSAHDRVLVLLSAVAAVAAIPAAFAGAMYRVSGADPDAFSEPLSKVDALYVSVITFTTTGFRDISPRSSTARLLVVFELLSTFVAAVLAIVLVARRLRRRSAPAPDGTG